MNLIGKFHSHITVLDGSRASDILDINNIRHKATTIKLSGDGAEQIDVMITQHFHTRRWGSYSNIKAEILRTKKILTDSGVAVIRVKIEHEDLPTIPPSEFNYRECHIKMRIPNSIYCGLISKLSQDTKLNKFRLSNNPNEVKDEYTHHFLNARVYSGTIIEFDSNVQEAANHLRGLGVNVIEAKIESTIYDSRLSHDRWWA